MSEPNYGNFFDRHPRLTRYGALLIVALVVGTARYFWNMYDKYDRNGIERPGIYLEEDVKDTGEYVARDEQVLVDKDDKSYVGKHVRLVTTLRNSDEERQKGKYMCLVTDLAQKGEKYYVLMSDEPILRRSKLNFVEVDGLVSGHLISEKKEGNITRRNITILEVVDIQDVADDDALGKLSPVIRTVEPAVSATENGVTASLERIEYCDDMTRCHVRVENGSDWNVTAVFTVCRPDGEEIREIAGVNRLVRALANPVEMGFDIVQMPGESKTRYRSVEPIAEDEAFEVHVKIEGAAGKVEDGAFGLDEDEWEIVLEYAPESKAETNTGGAGDDGNDPSL